MVLEPDELLATDPNRELHFPPSIQLKIGADSDLLSWASQLVLFGIEAQRMEFLKRSFYLLCC